LLRDKIKSQYEQAGYKDVQVSIRYKLPQTPIKTLAVTDVTGITKLGTKAGKPLQVDIEGGSANAPIDLGCTLEMTVDVFLSVVGTDGKRVRDTGSSKIVVRGAIR